MILELAKSSLLLPSSNNQHAEIQGFQRQGQGYVVLRGGPFGFSCLGSKSVDSDVNRRTRAAGQVALMADPKVAFDESLAARQALERLPDSEQKTLLAGRVDWLAGAALISLGRAPEAMPALESGLKTARSTPRSKLYGDLTFAHGTALFALGRSEAALGEFRHAFDVYRAIGERRGQALALQNIGMVYVHARDYDRAIRYFTQSAETFSGDPALLMSVNNNAGLAFAEQGKFDQAISRFSAALALARRVTSPVVQVRIIVGLAGAQLQAGKVADARRSVDEGMRLSSRSGSPAWQSALDTVAAEVALKLGRTDEAARLIEEGLAPKNASFAVAGDAHRVAYEIYKARGEETRALEHLEQYKKLDDQARATAASANAALLSAQFDYANQRASIAQLRANEVQSEAAIARGQRTILLILLVGTGIVTTLLLFGIISIRRSRDQVRAANEELSETNVELEQALTARTQFLATTSHEIRTPLNGILGMTQVLLADRSLDGEVKSKIELVHGAGETMRALVDDILDVAKITNGELRLYPAEMDFHRLLRDTAQVWTSQAQAKNISLAVDLGDAPERIVEDEVRLRQIVFNLTANAVKFTDRGEVRLTAQAVAGGGEGDERLQVRIEDTGIGIPPDKLEEIFESFRQVDSGTTRRHGGTGLGLAICRNLAKAMGGDIGVESVLGAGATFTLDIPLVRVASVAPASLAQEGGTLEAARLLLVEANPLSQSILRAVLSSKVASVAVVGTVEEARVTLAGGTIDLLLMDANTLGKDIALAGELAQPVVAAGGRAVMLWPAPDDEIRNAAETVGITKLLGTPLAAPDLVTALGTLYGPSNAPAGIAA